jgi:hypothetical protein
MPMHKTMLGDHLRKRRLELGLLQKEAPEQIGVNISFSLTPLPGLDHAHAVAFNAHLIVVGDCRG